MSVDQRSAQLYEALGHTQETRIAATEGEAGERPTGNGVARRCRTVEYLLGPRDQVVDLVALGEQSTPHARGERRWDLAGREVGQQVVRQILRGAQPVIVAGQLEGVEVRVERPRDVAGGRVGLSLLGAPPRRVTEVAVRQRVENFEAGSDELCFATHEQGRRQHRVPFEDDLLVASRLDPSSTRRLQRFERAEKTFGGLEGLAVVEAGEAAAFEKAGRLHAPSAEDAWELSLESAVSGPGPHLVEGPGGVRGFDPAGVGVEGRRVAAVDLQIAEHET